MLQQASVDVTHSVTSQRHDMIYYHPVLSVVADTCQCALLVDLVSSHLVVVLTMTSISARVRAVPVQRLRHPVQEGGAARRGDGGHGERRRRVRLQRAAVRVRQGGGVARRRRVGRARQRAVPRLAGQRRRAGPGFGARRRLAGTDQLVQVQLVTSGGGTYVGACVGGNCCIIKEGATFFFCLGEKGS
jgi:hypothetical protein